MLQQPAPDDYVVATGEMFSVREYVRVAFAYIGSGADEKGIDPDGRVLVEVDPRYFRPTEVDMLVGDSSKAKAKLGWKPRVDFHSLVRMMVDSDLALAAAEKHAHGSVALHERLVSD